MAKGLIFILIIALAIIGLISIQKGGLTFSKYPEYSFTKYDPESNENNNQTNQSENISNNYEINLGFDCPLPGDGLHLDNLTPFQEITFPFSLEGKVGPGHWAVFEGVAGSFKYFDIETNNQIGGQTEPWTISGEWMTEDPKPFSINLPSPTTFPESNQIKIVFSEANEADESEHQTHTCEIVVTANN